MKTLLAALAAAATLAGTSLAAAQAYPSHSITMVVPFSAGGPTDTIARIMTERMGKALGQTVVVENVTGAAGSIGVARVARAAPDGYTLSIGHWSTHVINGAVYQLSYDLLKDFEPVAMIATNPQLIALGRKALCVASPPPTPDRTVSAGREQDGVRAIPHTVRSRLCIPRTR
jgi:tripartite-type tricarboxylate transporter receptor subunit TctC